MSHKSLPTLMNLLALQIYNKYHKSKQVYLKIFRFKFVANITNIIQKRPAKVDFFIKPAENPTLFRY